MLKQKQENNSLGTVLKNLKRSAKKTLERSLLLTALQMQTNQERDLASKLVMVQIARDLLVLS